MNVRIVTLLSSVLIAVANAQMDKRHRYRYRAETFRSAAPAVGAPAPELELKDLDGRCWSLGTARGKTLVIVGGGFT